jgi:hypothetical protein
MKMPRFLLRKKHRKYPIQRDESGKSLRARCFELFEEGKRPVEVAEELKVKVPTVCRYFRDWQRLGPDFKKQYAFLKEMFKKTAPDRSHDVQLFSQMLRIDEEQFEAILSRPHGLKQLLTGKLYFPVQADADHKRHIVLALAVLIAEHVIDKRGKFEDIYFALRALMQENMKNRKEQEADIKEENKVMGYFHQIVAADMELERQGHVIPDRLTTEEISIVLKWEQQSLKKTKEVRYFKSIAALMVNRLTEEQAREKIYQDLLDKGDLEGAKAMRAYQDIVHPLKHGDQSPPSTRP